MKKKNEIDNNVINLEALVHPRRLPVSTRHFVLDDHIETVQDQAESVQKLYTDFVLGKLDPRQLAGSAVYDDEDAQEVDPFNHFGVTFEETSQVAERGTEASAEILRRKLKKQDEAAQKQKEELKNQLRKEIEEEMRAKEEK